MCGVACCAPVQTAALSSGSRASRQPAQSPPAAAAAAACHSAQPTHQGHVRHQQLVAGAHQLHHARKLGDLGACGRARGPRAALSASRRAVQCLRSSAPPPGQCTSAGRCTSGQAALNTRAAVPVSGCAAKAAPALVPGSNHLPCQDVSGTVPLLVAGAHCRVLKNTPRAWLADRPTALSGWLFQQAVQFHQRTGQSWHCLAGIPSKQPTNKKSSLQRITMRADSCGEPMRR